MRQATLLGVLIVSEAVCLAQLVPPKQTVWFAPLDPKVSYKGIGSFDYMSLFSPSAAWQNAASRTQVFKLYSTSPFDYFMSTAFAGLLADLKRRNIELALETPMLTPDGCGSTIEGFWPVGATIALVSQIKSMGGDLRYIMMDEPFQHANMEVSPGACHWAAEQVVKNALVQIAGIKAIYPQVVIGDIEAVPPPAAPADWLQRYETWFDTWRSISGAPLPLFHTDVNWGDSTWRSGVDSIRQAVAARGTSFGIIYNGWSAQSDAEWLASAEVHFEHYETTGGTPPADAIFQSWDPYPSHVLPETDPTAFTYLINRYFRERTSVSLNAAHAQAAGMLADSQGRPLASAPIQVTATPTVGEGAISSYIITGTVPSGVITALVGVRVNIECGCQAASNTTLYSFQYSENSQSQPTATRDFSKGLTGWGLGPGTATLEPGPAQFGQGLHIVAQPTQAVLLNSSTFPATPGASFSLQITARVSPDSVGSGYFMIVFLTAADGSGESSRQTLNFQPATISLGSINTRSDGSYSLSLPPEDSNSYQIEVDYAGNDTYWPAAATGQLFPAKNSASYTFGVPLAPDMIAFGQAPGIAPALFVASTNPWPATLGGAHVTITDSQGQTRSAPMYFVNTNSMSFLIPSTTALGHTTLQLTTSTGAIISSTLDIERVSPGLYTANASGSGAPAGYWIRAAANGTQSYDYLFDLNTRNPVPIDLGPATDQVFLSLYGTGFRGATLATATVGSLSIPVSGLAAVGVYQGEDVVNIGPLPRSLAGRGQVDVVTTFDGKIANTVTISIR